MCAPACVSRAGSATNIFTSAYSALADSSVDCPQMKQRYRSPGSRGSQRSSSQFDSVALSLITSRYPAGTLSTGYMVPQMRVRDSAGSPLVNRTCVPNLSAAHGAMATPTADKSSGGTGRITPARLQTNVSGQAIEMAPPARLAVDVVDRMSRGAELGALLTTDTLTIRKVERKVHSCD
jgi:hypothetical protein